MKNSINTKLEKIGSLFIHIRLSLPNKKKQNLSHSFSSRFVEKYLTALRCETLILATF